MYIIYKRINSPFYSGNLLLIGFWFQISPTETVNNEIHLGIRIGIYVSILRPFDSVFVNDARYKMYRGSGGVISGENLPPRFDSMKQNIKRASYQAAVWRRS